MVEDETRLRNSLQRGLTALNDDLEVLSSPSAEEAEKLFHEAHFDLLVTDLVLPGMNGLELIKKIKKASPDTICIIITGLAEVDSTIKALQSGVDNFLKKPVSINELHLVIQKSIREKTFYRHHLEIQQNFIEFLNSTPDGMIICDLNNLIIFSNESAARLTGFSTEDLVNLNITEIIMPTPALGNIG
ncbi:MAG: response regulator [FCB group bacterium]|nr:response regulator [FCB group bacterium]